jgi:signal-transduction protein with cAMP-binding, CBS, and nucleotidyltransferase domain
MIIKERPEYQQKSPALQFEQNRMVKEAVDAMAAKNYGASAITDEHGKLVGIFSERDLMRRVIAAGKDPATTPLREVMTSDVRVASVDDDLLDWLRIMSNERFRHLPVIEEGSKEIIMMSQGDFVSYTWPQLLHRVSEQTRASLGGGFYPVLIIIGVLLYTLLLLLF